jgi:hypothetical protein
MQQMNVTVACLLDRLATLGSVEGDYAEWIDNRRSTNLGLWFRDQSTRSQSLATSLLFGWPTMACQTATKTSPRRAIAEGFFGATLAALWNRGRGANIIRSELLNPAD